jgi:HSP20 family protein
MDETKRLTPCTCFFHDDQEGRLKIEVEMPGVNKKDIALEMRRDSFCVSAPRGDNHYSGCFKLTHEVAPEKAEAKYEDGLLRVFAPIKDWEKTSKIMIH